MLKVLKTLLLSLFYVKSFPLNLNYEIVKDKISFDVQTNVVGNNDWWFGMCLYTNYSIIDSIIVSNINNNISINAYNIDYISLMDNKINYTNVKNNNYIQTSDIKVNDIVLNTKFTRLLDTQIINDVVLNVNSNLGITFLKNFNTFPSQYNFILSTNIVLKDIPEYEPPITIPKHELPFDMFYPSLFTTLGFLIYGSILFGLSKTKYIHYLRKPLFIFKEYISVNSLVFSSLFIIWWLTMCIYSLIDNRVNITLFRLGVFIMMNMGLILLPVTRNSIWITIFKLTHKEFILSHRIMAIMCIVTIIIKFIVILFNYEPYFLIIIKNELTGGSPLAGTLSTFSAILMGLFSMRNIIKIKYETFYFTHRILSIITVATAIWHYTLSLYYLIPSLILYIIDLFMRYLHINKGLYLKLNTIGKEENNTSCVIINVKMKKFIETKPGCYFLICVRNISSFQWHPFSLIEQNKNSLTFCAKNMGPKSWTDKLQTLVSSSREEMYNREIYIQGPYNYFDINHIINKYEYIINIAGGIGVTPIFSIIEYINEMIYLKKVNTKKILFVWMVPYDTLVDYFLEKINSFDLFNTDIEIYITKQTYGDQNYPSYIKYSKPTIDTVIYKFGKKYAFNNSKACILGSGPKLMLENIKKVANNFNIDNFCEEF